MSAADISGFSVSGLAHLRADATLRVDSATGQLRVTDRKNPFQRVITWVRDTMGLRSKDAVQTEKGEIRATYNRFFRSIAEDLRYREQVPALQETLAANIIGKKPKPLSVRMVRQIMADLEQVAARGAGSGRVAAAAADSSRVRQENVDAPDDNEAALQEQRQRPTSAGDIAHGDGLEQMEWDHEAEYPDPDKELEAEANRMITELDPGFLDREWERKSGRRGERPPGTAGNDSPDTPVTAETDADAALELELAAASAAAADTELTVDPYQTVFIDDLDEGETEVGAGGRNVADMVQQRLQAIAARMKDSQPEAAAPGNQIHPGHSDVVNAALAEVHEEMQQLEIEAMAMGTEERAGARHWIRERFLSLEQEYDELERLQQA